MKTINKTFQVGELFKQTIELNYKEKLVKIFSDGGVLYLSFETVEQIAKEANNG